MRWMYSNKCYGDILMREELQKYADEQRDRFKVQHVLSSEPEDKSFKVGACMRPVRSR